MVSVRDACVTNEFRNLVTTL